MVQLPTLVANKGAEMPGTIRPNPKSLLSVTGALEAATGLALLVAPSALVELLLGTAPDAPAGVTVSRVAGVALLALGVACWLAREDATGRAAKGLVTAMLLYNVAVVAILVLAWMRFGLSGIGFWPVVLAHAALAVWCVACLSTLTLDEKQS
jgi:hypothetical protein